MSEVTEFQLVDAAGTVIGRGEREEGVYRAFLPQFTGGYREFDTIEDMFAATAATAMQEELFPLPARTQQMNLFPKGDTDAS